MTVATFRLQFRVLVLGTLQPRFALSGLGLQGFKKLEKVGGGCIWVVLAPSTGTTIWQFPQIEGLLRVSFYKSPTVYVVYKQGTGHHKNSRMLYCSAYDTDPSDPSTACVLRALTCREHLLSSGAEVVGGCMVL